MRDRPPASNHETALDDDLRHGVSVVVPCFNSGATLEPLVNQLIEVLSARDLPFEILLVDDASRDDSWSRIERIAEHHVSVRGIAMMRNYGQHNVTLCGCREAQFDVTVTVDDDLQHPPSEIPKLLDRLAEGHDVVYGTPLRMPHSGLRNLGSWFAKYAIAVATQQRGVRELSAFRAFRTSLRRSFRDYNSPQVLFDVLLGWGSTRIVSTPVRHDARRSGASNYGMLQLIAGVMRLWVGYTTAPLRFAAWTGFASVLFGIGVFAYVVWTYFTQGSIPGFPFLASTIAVFGGVQLFTLGIIGEYLARMYERGLGRPAYVVKVTSEPSGKSSATPIDETPEPGA